MLCAVHLGLQLFWLMIKLNLKYANHAINPSTQLQKVSVTLWLQWLQCLVERAVLSIFIDLHYVQCVCLYYGLCVCLQTNKLNKIKAELHFFSLKANHSLVIVGNLRAIFQFAMVVCALMYNAPRSNYVWENFMLMRSVSFCVKLYG